MLEVLLSENQERLTGRLAEPGGLLYHMPFSIRVTGIGSFAAAGQSAAGGA
jgi:hypothetical protein